MTSSVNGLHRQAEQLARSGRLRQALPVWGEALRQDPDNVEVLVALGHALGAVGERDNARELATRACRLAPAQPGPWRLLGLLAVDDGHLPEAIEAFELARARASVDEAAAIAADLARALLKAGQPDAAVAAVAGLETAAAFLARGHVLALRGDDDGARRAFVRAGELDPDDPEPYKRLAALLVVSDRGLARELARHALELAPQDPETRALVDGLV
jgi:Flp pilus assembly protein TadD